MTPPAIAPALGPELPPDDELVGGWAPILVHCVTAHVLHPPPMSEHTSSEAQCGHWGGLDGHWAHLRKRVGELRSASTEWGQQIRDIAHRARSPKLTETNENVEAHVAL